MPSDYQSLQDQAKAVLASNDRGEWTVPASDLYPHQWLWDSCFIAIGLRHYDVSRAQIELKSLLRGQWSNGMVPDIIFRDPNSRLDEILWDSALSPFAPTDVATSGITQPPMITEAVYLVGQKLKGAERRSWYKQMLPGLIRFHQWLYRERDPNHEGLVTLFHPYESGMDNSPPWINELYDAGIPLWVRVIGKLHLDFLVNMVRRDTRHVDSKQRMSTTEVLSLFVALRRMRRKSYDSAAILKKPYMAVQDLGFNSILARSNSRLKDMAKASGKKLPAKLIQSMELTARAIETLWDEEAGRYRCRSLRRRALILEPSIMDLLPLYAGTISAERAKRLVDLLNKRGEFKTLWPVPSTPKNSSFYDPVRYWQGPSWISTNWLIIQGLKKYGFDKEAEFLSKRSLDMVAKNGCSEYYDPDTGAAHGAQNFSWTAALAIDLLKS